MHIASYAPWGAEGIVVRVEVDIRRGIPGVDITGLADGAVREARERVRAAFRNSGFAFPQDRVLVNLAPAGVRKEGAALDLPIALAILAAAGLVPSPAGLMALGELELSGKVRGVRGVLAAASAGLAEGIEGFIVPAENGGEALILAAGRTAAVSTLAEAAHALELRGAGGKLPTFDTRPSSLGARNGKADRVHLIESCGDFSHARGQETYKRALEIAAAGGHNLLAFGAPGAGKTMLARRLPGIMAPLDTQEAVAATRLHSLAGALGPQEPLVSQPPFRSPHHSASAEGMLGGGRSVRPGEISLAHFGVLFLDEAPEYRLNVLRALREPLEDGVVTIARADGSTRLPADFQLVLAANPCPCGRLGKPGSACFCASDEVERHWRRLGAALLDRIELRVPLSPASSGKPSGDGTGASIGKEAETSAAVALRVERAVAVQRQRLGSLGLRRNSRLPPGLVERFCSLDAASRAAFDRASELFGFSERARDGILKVSRTIADLESADSIKREHLLEAIQHRRYGDDPYDVLAVGMPSI